jgi:Fe-Mn family superoxide dismutase
MSFSLPELPYAHDALAPYMSRETLEYHHEKHLQFGSGWCWLAVEDGKIVVMKTLNGENPLVHGGEPILGCDVWEHSYYIDYRNRRPDYLKAFVDHLINWEYVAEMYRAAAK